MTEVSARCREWQELLGLDDWKIEVKLVPSEKMYGSYGQNDYSLAGKTAVVKLRDPSDSSYDMEEVLLHELLHILLDVPYIADGHSYEEILGRLSRALLKLKGNKHAGAAQGKSGQR